MFVVVFALAKPAECWWTFGVFTDLVFTRMPDELLLAIQVIVVMFV